MARTDPGHRFCLVRPPVGSTGASWTPSTPAFVDQAEPALRNIPGVRDVTAAQLRWIGHGVPTDVEHKLTHAVPRLITATVHTDPASTQALTTTQNCPTKAASGQHPAQFDSAIGEAWISGRTTGFAANSGPPSVDMSVSMQWALDPQATIAVL